MVLTLILACLPAGIVAQSSSINPCVQSTFASGDPINLGIAIAFNRSLEWWSSGGANASSPIAQEGSTCSDLKTASGNGNEIAVAAFKLNVDRISALRIERTQFANSTGGTESPSEDGDFPVSTAVLFRADNDGGSLRSEPRIVRSKEGVPRTLGAAVRMIEGKIQRILWSKSSCNGCPDSKETSCSNKNVADESAEGVSTNAAACFDTHEACFTSGGSLGNATENAGRCRPVMRIAFGGTDKNFAPLQTQQTSLNIDLSALSNLATSQLPSNPVTDISFTGSSEKAHQHQR